MTQGIRTGTLTNQDLSYFQEEQDPSQPFAVPTGMEPIKVSIDKPKECPMVDFQSKKTDELNAALAQAQGEFPAIGNAASIKFMDSKYTKINGIIKSVQSHLKEAGLSVSHHAIREDGNPMLLSVLRHSSGQWTTNRAKIEPENTDFLSYSTRIGQLKRIAFMSMLNITTGDQE